jgi:hypothetical protein
VPIYFSHAESLKSVRGTSLSLIWQQALRSTRGCFTLSWWEDPLHLAHNPQGIFTGIQEGLRGAMAGFGRAVAIRR